MIEKLYNIKEAAPLTRMSVAWWRQKVFEKKIRFVRIGRRILIPESTIRALVETGLIEAEDGFGNYQTNSFNNVFGACNNT